MKAKIKRKWTAARWLRRLEAADLPEKVKATGRAFMEAHGLERKRPRWVAPWELPGSPGYSSPFVADLRRIGRQNLMVFESGYFAPCIGPRVPRAGEYTLSDAHLALLTDMLTRRGGRCLWYIVQHGYIDQPDAKPRWLLKSTGPGPNGKWPPTVAVPSAVVLPLIRRCILERSGCTWGGFHWTIELRVNPYRLYVAGNLPQGLRKHQREEA